MLCCGFWRTRLRCQDRSLLRLRELTTVSLHTTLHRYVFLCGASRQCTRPAARAQQHPRGSFDGFLGVRCCCTFSQGGVNTPPFYLASHLAERCGVRVAPGPRRIGFRVVPCVRWVGLGARLGTTGKEGVVGGGVEDALKSILLISSALELGGKRGGASRLRMATAPCGTCSSTTVLMSARVMAPSLQLSRVRGHVATLEH